MKTVNSTMLDMKNISQLEKKITVRDKRAQLFAFLLPVTYTTSPTPGNQRAQAVCSDVCTLGPYQHATKRLFPILPLYWREQQQHSQRYRSLTGLSICLRCNSCVHWHWLIRPDDHATGEWATRVRFVSRMDSYADWDIKQDPGAVFERWSEVATIKSVNNWINFEHCNNVMFKNPSQMVASIFYIEIYTASRFVDACYRHGNDDDEDGVVNWLFIATFSVLLQRANMWDSSLPGLI